MRRHLGRDVYMNPEPLFDPEQTGVQMFFFTNTGEAMDANKSHPVHWHSVIELVYILNGSGKILLDGTEHFLVPGEFLVIDTNQMHECWYKRDTMMAVVQYSRKVLKNLVPDLDRYAFQCAKGTLRASQLDVYLQISDTLKQLPPLCLLQPVGYRVRSYAVAMEIFSELLEHFALEREPVVQSEQSGLLERLNEITEYIEEHHAEPLSLQEIASHFYLSREYFSRFFKKHMGVSFLNYLQGIRLVHIYQDICNTRAGIMEIAERHGFTNYKLFGRLFRDAYGCSPREIRKKRDVT